MFREHRRSLGSIPSSTPRAKNQAGVGLSLWRTLASKESEIGQRVGEFLIGHGGVWKHPRAWVPFPDSFGSRIVAGQPKAFRTSQIDWWRIELSDERGGVGCELRSLFNVPIHAMAVIAHALPVKDCSAPLGIACHRHILWRRRRTGPGIHLKHVYELDRH